MRLLDLFSGIGGFSLAASWVWGDELDIVGFCENDKYCQKILNKHWPEVPIYNDINLFKGTDFDSIELITGGFPCQGFSVAGKRKGKKDDRYLWPEMFRIVQETKPNWIIGENVTGIINMALDTALFDLESEGYETQTFNIPACGVNAPHKRERVWIVANNPNNTLNGEVGKFSERENTKPSRIYSNVANTTNNRLQRQLQQNSRETTGTFEALYTEKFCRTFAEQLPTPYFCRGSDGISDRMDRTKALGNAIVPQVAMVIMQAIKDIELNLTKGEHHAR